MAKIPFGKKIQQIRSLGALWKYRSELYRMFRDAWRGKYKFSFLTIIALVAGIGWLISPMNIMTDLIPVVGWVDDGFVIYFLLKRLMHELNRYEARQSPPAGTITLVQ